MLWNGGSQLMLFSLVSMRMAGLIFLNPVFGRRNVPNNIKAAFTFTLTLMVYTYAEGTLVETPSSLIYGFLLLKEFAVGYVLGYVMELFFFVITYAGTIIDFQIGMSMSQVYDPQTNAQIAMTGTLYQIFYTLIFFAVDGHLVLMKILLTSGEIVPYGEVAFTQGLALAILDVFRECVVLAIRFSFPLLAMEFLVQIAVGIMMKLSPQINIFVTNIQIKIAVGFLMLLLLVTPMKGYLEGLLDQMLETIQEILTLM